MPQNWKQIWPPDALSVQTITIQIFNAACHKQKHNKKIIKDQIYQDFSLLGQYDGWTNWPDFSFNLILNFYSSCLPPDPKVPFRTRKMGWRVAVLAASFSFLSCSWLITPKVSCYLPCPRVKIQSSNNKQGPDFTSWPQPKIMCFVRQQWKRDFTWL